MIGFTYIEPLSIDEALSTLAQYGDEAKPIAGGTGLVNLMKQQLVHPGYLVGLRRLTGLRRMSYEGGLHIGALATLRTLETSPLIIQHAPLLAEASRLVATIRIRSMATIGGALAHADPNEDLPPALMALDARVFLSSQTGVRELAVAKLFSGYYETVIRPDELVTEIVIPPLLPNTGAAFLKFLPQTRDDYATVAVAALVSLADDRLNQVRVALGAAGPTPLRASQVEDSLRGEVPTAGVLRHAAELVREAVDPISDFRGSADYKREMAMVFTRRALAQAVVIARGGGALG